MSQEVIRLLQAQCHETSRKEKDLIQKVREFHGRQKRNLEKRQAAFHGPEGSGMYTIELQEGEVREEYAWFRRLAEYCAKGLGYIRPLNDATGSGGGAGGRAAAETPNARLNDKPVTIVFASGLSTDDDARIDIDAILNRALKDRDGRLEFTFDSVKHDTASFATKTAAQLRVDFDATPAKAPDWYNALMGLEVQQGFLADLKASGKKRKWTHVRSYNPDESSDFRQLKNSMMHTLRKTTKPREKKLAAKEVEMDLQKDETVPVFDTLQDDGYEGLFKQRSPLRLKPEEKKAVAGRPAKRQRIIEDSDDSDVDNLPLAQLAEVRKGRAAGDSDGKEKGPPSQNCMDDGQSSAKQPNKPPRSNPTGILLSSKREAVEIMKDHEEPPPKRTANKPRKIVLPAILIAQAARKVRPCNPMPNAGGNEGRAAILIAEAADKVRPRNPMPNAGGNEGRSSIASQNTGIKKPRANERTPSWSGKPLPPIPRKKKEGGSPSA